MAVIPSSAPAENYSFGSQRGRSLKLPHSLFVALFIGESVWYDFSRYGRFKTLAMIKPETSTLHYEEIKSIIMSHGFDITAEQHQQLTVERATEFYAEHEGKPFFDGLVGR